MTNIKVFLISILCTLMYSCTVPRDMNGELQGEWHFVNTTDLDLKVCHQLRSFGELYGEYEHTNEYFLPSQGSASQMYDRFYNDKLLDFQTFFLIYEENVTSCRIYITNTAGGVLKEWVMGEDNGEHDIFNEENWDYQHWYSEHEELFCLMGTYFAEHHKWTFTITNDDLVRE